MSALLTFLAGLCCGFFLREAVRAWKAYRTARGRA